MEDKRYIENPYPDYVDGSSEINEKELMIKTEQALEKSLEILFEKSPPNSSYSIESSGKKGIDLTMYTGTFGNVYIYWRIYLMYKNRKNIAKSEEFFKHAMDAFNTNDQLAIKYSKPSSKSEKKSPSFFMGESGLYTLGALLFLEKNDLAASQKCYKKVLSAFELCKVDYAQDELLYGNAGYLYCLLLLYKTNKVQFNCKAQIIEAVELLKKSGESLSGAKSILTFSFPREKGTFYYGGAHGSFGIVYEMLKACELVEELKANKELMTILENTCDHLITLQFPSGNFPSSYGGKKDKLVHFCHGAPGAIPMLLQAHKLFQKETYLVSASNAGEAIWHRGILLKGNGICHGITGNAYMLHSLYRYMSKDSRWKHRFACFAGATWDEKIQNIVQNYKDPQRITTGMPDTPYSLMEGLGGTVVFYADILNEMLFPGFEI